MWRTYDEMAQALAQQNLAVDNSLLFRGWTLQAVSMTLGYLHELKDILQTQMNLATAYEKQKKELDAMPRQEIKPAPAARTPEQEKKKKENENILFSLLKLLENYEAERKAIDEKYNHQAADLFDKYGLYNSDPKIRATQTSVLYKDMQTFVAPVKLTTEQAAEQKKLNDKFDQRLRERFGDKTDHRSCTVVNNARNELNTRVTQALALTPGTSQRTDLNAVIDDFIDVEMNKSNEQYDVSQQFMRDAQKHDLAAFKDMHQSDDPNVKPAMQQALNTIDTLEKSSGVRMKPEADAQAVPELDVEIRNIPLPTLRPPMGG